ncbi:MAG: hypothetical protein NTZ54_10380, partial [Alphaproteobacteria bacterium]|nr:hypothetical protein [Alphaproteobacteria bacterium]
FPHPRSTSSTQVIGSTQHIVGVCVNRIGTVDFIILLAFCLLGYRMTITQKMVRQYPWLYESAGPLGWKNKG